MLGFCIDCGTNRSGVCFYDQVFCMDDEDLVRGKLDNDCVLDLVRLGLYDILVMEDITPQGFIGKTTIETVKWLGRFEQVARDRGKPVVYIARAFIKKHLTGKVNKIKDSHIRQAVIDRINPRYTLKNPGPLKGVTADVWSAVAVGIVWSETRGRVV